MDGLGVSHLGPFRVDACLGSKEAIGLGMGGKRRGPIHVVSGPAWCHTRPLGPAWCTRLHRMRPIDAGTATAVTADGCAAPREVCFHEPLP